MSSSRPHVLVVDDERDVADLYAAQLGDAYETTVAYGGEAALDTVGPNIDAVLLDRRMPDVSGDTVLETIRERDLDCVVVMVTAVDPDLNILEMEFDDYLPKPVDKETLRTTLDRNLDTAGRSERIERYFTLLSKLEVLVGELSAGELEESEEFKETAQEVRTMTDQLRDELEDFDALVETYQTIEPPDIDEDVDTDEFRFL